MKLKPLHLGKLIIQNPILLAPMVEVTDLPYRMLCRKAGAELAYIEMLYIDAILHENKHTLNLMKTVREDKPLGIQITGNSPEEFKKVIPYLKPYDLVDINCGCPSIKITGNQAGSYLLQHPEKIAQMIKILKAAGLVVTAKIRLGFKENNVLKVAKAIEAAGADAITVHARLATHGASTPADWSQIAKVKKILKIPVIGNGDITNGKQAESMLKIADGVMIARAAIGDPLVFHRINHYLKTGEELPFNPEKNKQQLKDYIKLTKKYKSTDMGKIKYVATSFIKGFKGAAQKRQQLMTCKSLEDIEELIKELF
ncbi:MAG TPA: tRNA-dihydrouridine synthase family protein [Candidatus Nanoarchaeia archaeon]|nr:tRNA-dihydrouridine synthase family protein [Candidatus Nanoarchaeia archaeon]